MADASETQPLLNSQAVLRARRTLSKKQFLIIGGLGFVACALLVGVTLPLVINHHKLRSHDVIDPDLVQIRVFDSNW